MEPQAYQELAQLETNHWWYRGMRHITETLLHGVLKAPCDLHILDAGCGTGGNLAALAKFGQVIGFDFSGIALTYTRQHHLGNIAQASIEAIPFASASFDLVTSFDVIYCQEVRDDVWALRELARVVRPAGHLLVRVPALPALRGYHDIVVHGARRYTAADLRYKLELAGLAPLRLTYANSLLLPAIFAVRRLQRLVPRCHPPRQSDVRPTPKFLNHLLLALLKVESRWIQQGRNWRLGVSLFALAYKPPQPTLSVATGEPIQKHSQG